LLSSTDLLQIRKLKAALQPPFAVTHIFLRNISPDWQLANSLHIMIAAAAAALLL
jgi:hypothetical protein